MSGVHIFRFLLLWVLFFSAQPLLFSQNVEAELKIEAEKLFEEEKYIEATPKYSSLVALNPRSADYQFHFGTCLLYNSYKKQDAFKYLNFAVTDPTIDVRAYYFLGRAYHLTYQFNDAIKNYELYKQKCGGKPKASFEVDRNIEMCQNGKRLLTTISDLVVLEKIEYDSRNFFRMFSLQDIGGDIIVASMHQSKIDKKKGFTPIIHFPAASKAIYFASYGESDSGQKDIYVKRKLPDGSWGLPQPVQGNVNTPYDEDFPYMHPGGEYLYFSSKGHNSMGGYDIFRCKLNPETNTFGPPENMDFAISSPDNDMFFIVDSLDNNAWFASSRQSSNGNMHVYKVRIDRVPLQLAVVKGTFASNIHPENKKITINVTDYASGEKIGTFSSNEKGSYLITFPKGGKYTYEMQVEGSKSSYKHVVSIPFLKEFKPLKQKIQEETIDNSELVRVIDLFNEEVEDPMGVLAEVIKMRSELNPNASQFDLELLNANKENSKIFAELGFEDATPGAVIAVFEQLEDKQEEKVATADNLALGALNQASEKLTAAAAIQEQVKTLVNQANASASKEQKFDLLSTAQEQLEKAENLKNDATALLSFSDSVRQKSTNDREKLEILKVVTEEVRKDVTNNNLDDLKEVLTGNAALIQSVKADATANPIDALVDEKGKVDKEQQTLQQQKKSFQGTQQQIEDEIAALKQDLSKAKAKDQPGIQRKIDSKTSELAMVNEQLTSLDNRRAKLVQKENSIDQRIAFLQDVTAVKSNPAISPEGVKQQLAAVDSKNNNTLAAYVNLQINDLMKDPAVQAMADNGEKDPVIEQIFDDYEERLAVANKSDDPRIKEEQLLSVERQKEEAINDAIKENEAALMNDPNDNKAIERKKKLEELRQQTQEQIREREDNITALTEENPVPVTPEKELEALSPDHEAKLKNTDKGSPEATLNAQNNLDRELIANANRELDNLNNQLQSNPGDKTATERKKAIEQVKTEATERINDRDELLATLGENESTTSPEKELEALSPDHEAKLKNTDKGSPEATLNAQNNLDRELIANANRELDNLNNQLQSNPGDKTATERKKAIEQVKTEATERISDRDELLATLGENESTTSPEKELEALSPDHEAKLKNTDKGSPEATLNAQNNLDRELIANANRELDNLNNQLQSNPGDKTATERKKAIEQVKTEATERINDRDELLASLPETSAEGTAKEAELEALSPRHREKLAAISEATPEATARAQNNLDQQLIDQLNSELEDVEGQLLRNPNNVQAKERQTTLAMLKEEALERIDTRNDAMAAMDEQPEQSENALAIATQSVRPEHKDNLSTIDASMEQGTKKELALLKEENVLLDALNKELKKKETALAKELQNEQLKAEVNTLREAVSLQESLISEREQDLVALEKAAINQEEYVQTVMPAYNKPDVVNRENYTEEQIADLTRQEQQLQDKLVTRLRANEKKLTRGFDPRLEAENKVIAELMEQSVNRQQTLNMPVIADPSVTERIANDLGAAFTFLMETEPKTVDEAKQQLTALHEYESALLEQLNENKNSDPVDASLIAQQEAQLQTVRKRIGLVEIDLDELESSVNIVANKTDSPAKKTLNDLKNTEVELQRQLDNPNLTSSQKKATEKELAVIRVQKADQEAKVAQETLAEAQLARKIAETDLNTASANDPLVVVVKERNNQLTDEKSLINTPVTLQNQIRNEERALQLTEATTDFVPVRNTFNDEGIVVSTPAELAETKRRFLLEIGQLEAVIQVAQKDPKREQEVAQLQKQRTVLTEAIAELEAMEAALASETIPQPGVKEGLETSLSYEEEVKLAAAPEYPALLEQQAAIQTTRGNLAAIITEKETARTQAQQAETSAERETAITTLRELTERENSIRTQLQTQEAALQVSLDKTTDKAAYENLLAREVAPTKPFIVPTEMLPTLGDGFELVTQPGTARSEKVLQVGTKPPSGLVYRVQVGAYAKPIREDLFKEFTPVTGEPLNNGITRYLAGYFGNRNRAIEAQGQIRGLGYADAFVVAYCDGNRITLAEARRLEDLGLCVPKNQDSLLMEVVENTLAQLPADSVARLRPTPKPDDYNKAPGAAIAEAAELHKGLYYTVQVGVYNRPVPASQVKNIDPLVTKRLENGQIRYSSGMFHSVAEARPKRAEAIERGITDAFITAYYNGERITIDEANRLLEMNGVAILEPKSTVVPANAIDLAREYAQNQPQALKETRLQFVSTDSYESYPRAEIASLNMHGSFYFDAQDGRIKSTEYLPEEAFSRASTLLKGMDTVSLVENNNTNFERKLPSVVAEWEVTEMTGAMADWLLRISQPHAGTRIENGFRITFEGVAEANREELKQQLMQFGARSVKVDEENASDNR